MKLYAVAWKYESGDDPICNDFGGCRMAFADRTKAEAFLNSCAEESFNEWCDEDCEPKMTHDPDYAKVDDGNGSFYEFRVITVNKED